MKYESQLKAMILFLIASSGFESFAQNIYRNCLPDDSSVDSPKVNLLKTEIVRTGTSENWTMSRLTELSSGNWTSAQMDKMNSGKWTMADTKELLASGNWTSAATLQVRSGDWDSMLVQECDGNEWTNDEIDHLLSSGNWTVKSAERDRK